MPFLLQLNALLCKSLLELLNLFVESRRPQRAFAPRLDVVARALHVLVLGVALKRD